MRCAMVIATRASLPARGTGTSCRMRARARDGNGNGESDGNGDGDGDGNVDGRVEARTDTDTDTGTREAGGEEELAGNVGHVDEGKDLQGLHGPWRAGSARAGLGLRIDMCGVSMQVPCA